ncbi:MAG: glycosyltransferase family 39 protein [Bacteroidota bacterium]
MPSKRNFTSSIKIDPGRSVPVLFFCLYALLGITICPDYGISWDENVQRRHGLVSADYVNEQFGNFLGLEEKLVPEESLNTYHQPYYGILFSITGFFLEQIFDYEHNGDQFLIRHYLSFALFFLGMCALYQIGCWRFKDWKLALLGVLLVVLSPRLFGNSFYNPKDIPLLAWFIISTWTMLRMLNTGRVYWVLLHGIATAAVINTRVLGTLIFAATIALCIIDLIKDHNQLPRKILMLVGYVVVASGFTVFFWPYLWEAPLENFIYCFEVMSKFPQVLYPHYLGDFFPSTQVPWHYVPVWILITTPIITSLLAIFGGGLTIHRLIKNNIFIYRTPKEQADLMFLGLACLPILAVIGLDSNLYDGWRQMYFVFPFWALLAVRAVKYFQKWHMTRLIVAGLLTVQLTYTAFQMAEMHPHQNVYFSALAGTNPTDNFDGDYWGLCYKQLLETLAEINQREKGPIPVRAKFTPGPALHNLGALPHEIKMKFTYNFDKEPPYYYLTNFRTPEVLYAFQEGKPPFDKGVYILKIQGNPIGGIFWIESGKVAD